MAGQTLAIVELGSIADNRVFKACRKLGTVEGEQRQKGKDHKINVTKKQKRFSPYETRQISKKFSDEN